MRRLKTRRPGEVNAGTDTLSQLLDREQQMASQLEAARADAERLVQEAREYTKQAEAACERMIAERTASLAASYELLFDEELRRIQAEAAQEGTRFTTPDPARDEALVVLLLNAIGATGARSEAAR